MVHTETYGFSFLEEKVQDHGSPKEIILHCLPPNTLLCLPPNLLTIYHDLSCAVLHSVLAYPSKRLDIVFDTYEEPSVWDCE